MDDRTARILRALSPESVDLLLVLMGGSATEKQLVDALPYSLSTVHRRLDVLADAGLLWHEPGVKHEPNRPWQVAHAAETDALMQSLLDLADRTESMSTAARKESRDLLSRSRPASGRASVGSP
jgi:DNA-binding IclR family transcriptional regulator